MSESLLVLERDAADHSFSTKVDFQLVYTSIPYRLVATMSSVLTCVSSARHWPLSVFSFHQMRPIMYQRMVHRFFSA